MPSWKREFVGGKQGLGSIEMRPDPQQTHFSLPAFFFFNYSCYQSQKSTQTNKQTNKQNFSSNGWVALVEGDGNKNTLP